MHRLLQRNWTIFYLQSFIFDSFDEKKGKEKEKEKTHPDRSMHPMGCLATPSSYIASAGNRREYTDTPSWMLLFTTSRG
jgi:hypothetical protein